MSTFPGRSAAAALIPVALCMRLFFGMAVDSPYALNASWLCPLIGLLFYLPFGMSVNYAANAGALSPWVNLSQGRKSGFNKPFAFIFALLLLYDATADIRVMASSSNIIALNETTVHLLILPLGMVAAIVVLLGMDAVGHSARIWLRILPLFGLILLLVQIRSFRIGWLAPFLGDGVGRVLYGGVYCAGCMALLTLPWLTALPDRNKRGILRYIIWPSAASSLLLLAFHMGAPAMISSGYTRAARIELILSNGRMSLSPQLLLDVLWFGGFLYLIASECAAAAVYLHIALPRIPVWGYALAEALGVSIAAIFNWSWIQASTKATQLYFPAIGIIFVLMMIVFLVRKGGDNA